MWLPASTPWKGPTQRGWVLQQQELTGPILWTIQLKLREIELFSMNQGKCPLCPRGLCSIGLEQVIPLLPLRGNLGVLTAQHRHQPEGSKVAAEPWSSPRCRAERTYFLSLLFSLKLFHRYPLLPSLPVFLSPSPPSSPIITVVYSLSNSYKLNFLLFKCVMVW